MSIQVYTGNGKGKTTAAIGLTMRALGANLKVLFAQFLKGQRSSELSILENLNNLTLRRYGGLDYIIINPIEEDYIEAEDGFEEIKKLTKENKYDIIVLDEMNLVLYYELIELDDFLDFLYETNTENIEIVLTGRHADRKILNMADLITEMKEVKHYYTDDSTPKLGVDY